MDPFNQLLWIGGTSVHLYTVVLLLCFALFDFCTFNYSAWGLVHAGALTGFSVHFYESMHAMFEYVFSGFLSSSVYLMNIPFTLVSVFLLVSIRRSTFNSMVPFFFGLAFFTFLYLGETGFYMNYGKTLIWGLSKLWVSAMGLMLFSRRKLS